MTPEETRELLGRYFQSDHGDTSMMADDVVFTDMLTGQEWIGPDAVQGMLDYIYNQAFNATAEVKYICYGPGAASLEAEFVGTQQQEFAGIPNTGRKVRAPLCVTYRCADGKITHGYVYSLLAPKMMMDAMG